MSEILQEPDKPQQSESIKKNEQSRISPKEGTKVIKDRFQAIKGRISQSFTNLRAEASHVDLTPEARELSQLSSELDTLNTDAEVPFDNSQRVVIEKNDQEERPETTVPPEDTESFVKEKLFPFDETDEAGFGRRIYTYGEKTFAFKGRDELPLYPTLQRSRTTMLGENPSWVKPDEYNQYRARIAETQEQTGVEHYIVNKSITGVIDLAESLGYNSESLQQIRGEIAEGKYSPDAIDLIDSLFAVNYISDSGEFLDNPSLDAEAIVVLSLLGDKEAQAIVKQKKVQMEKHDEKKRHEDGEIIDAEPLDPQELVVVHALSKEPQKVADGAYTRATTFDTTNGRIVRNTIHVALNHKVQGHLGGNWSDAGYTIISPFTKMMEANGVPDQLSTTDTWWTRNPGEVLTFPEATLVKPGGDMDEFYRMEGDQVVYKSENIGLEDLLKLSQTQPDGGFKDYFHKIDATLQNAIDEPFNYAIHPEIAALWSDDTHMKLWKYWYQKDDIGNSTTSIGSRLLEGFEPGSGATLEDRLREVLIESGAVGVAKTPDALDRTVPLLVNSLQNTLVSEINDLTVRSVIEEKGYTVQRGGSNDWGNDHGVRAQTEALARELGTDYGAHTYSDQGKLEAMIMRAQGASGAYIDQEFNNFSWKDLDVSMHEDSPIQRVSPKTRRALYASGILTSRIKTEREEDDFY